MTGRPLSYILIHLYDHQSFHQLADDWLILNMTFTPDARRSGLNRLRPCRDFPTKRVMFSKQDCGFTERVENQPGKKGAKVLGRVLGKLFSLKRTLAPSN